MNLVTGKIPIFTFLMILSTQINAACSSLVQKDPKNPIKITQSGNYCLTKNLRYQHFTECAIVIETNNVAIDLMGHTLQGNATSSSVVGPTIGGICSNGRRYIIVRNGTIIGFHAGVNLSLNGNNPSFTTGHLIENLHISGIGSIAVDGDDNLIRDNRLIGGSSLQSRPGIIAPGRRNLVKNNIVESKNAAGITISSYSIAEGNRLIGFIENNQPVGGGIGSGDGLHLTLVDNIIANGRVGLILKSGVIKNNILVNTKEPYTFISGTSKIIDGGGNSPALPK